MLSKGGAALMNKAITIFLHISHYNHRVFFRDKTYIVTFKINADFKKLTKKYFVLKRNRIFST